jgi:FkbM family methyltransferase
MSMLKSILNEYGVTPVLVDVGASGGAPTIWTEIAPSSTYIGFDPDRREIRTIMDGTYKKATIVNKAVGTDRSMVETRFFLTNSPYCSSTLRPNAKALEDYIFYELFEVVREMRTSATTLDQVLVQQGLTSIDWLKVDAQGTDLRIYESLSDDARNKLIAVDTEPGLLDAYLGEDLFVDVQRKLCADGFWLSRLDVRGTKRVSKTTTDALRREQSALLKKLESEQQRISPGWCEARYLRSLQWLKSHSASQREYILLWAFAIIDQQFGFALDVARELGTVLDDASLSKRLVGLTSSFLMQGASAISSPCVNTTSIFREALSFLSRRIFKFHEQ